MKIGEVVAREKVIVHPPSMCRNTHAMYQVLDDDFVVAAFRKEADAQLWRELYISEMCNNSDAVDIGGEA